jgi:hypothetical protein
MTSTTASLISFCCIFSGSLTGIVVRSALPGRYFTNEEKDVLRLGLGLITTLSALVLGLLISTAKSSYDAKRSQVTQIAADVILVDRSLELYGSETSNARRALRNQLAALADNIHSLGASSSKLQPSSEAELSDFYQMVRRLSPRDDGQRALKAEVLRISLELRKFAHRHWRERAVPYRYRFWLFSCSGSPPYLSASGFLRPGTSSRWRHCACVPLRSPLQFF